MTSAGTRYPLYSDSKFLWREPGWGDKINGLRQPLLLSLTERPSYKVSWLRDRDTLRVCRHDLIEAHIRPSVAFHGVGIVNNVDKLTLVIDSVRPDTKHARRSIVPALADGAGRPASG